MQCRQFRLALWNQRWIPTLHIPTGASVAFVGPSGAGKTTIIDVLLGVLNPDEGSVLISGFPPLLAVAKWPGAVSYVPQDVVIAAETIRENQWGTTTTSRDCSCDVYQTAFVGA